MAPPPASAASLNLRSAPSASPAVRSCCPSSMGVIHFGCSGGAGAACAESDAAALAGAAGGATTATGFAAAIRGRRTFTYPNQPPAPAPPSTTSQTKNRPAADPFFRLCDAGTCPSPAPGGSSAALRFRALKREEVERLALLVDVGLRRLDPRAALRRGGAVASPAAAPAGWRWPRARSGSAPRRR